MLLLDRSCEHDDLVGSAWLQHKSSPCRADIGNRFEHTAKTSDFDS
jgi:hypothetical protein